MITGLNIEHYWIIMIQIVQFLMTLLILKKIYHKKSKQRRIKK